MNHEVREKSFLDTAPADIDCGDVGHDQILFFLSRVASISMSLVAEPERKSSITYVENQSTRSSTIESMSKYYSHAGLERVDNAVLPRSGSEVYTPHSSVDTVILFNLKADSRPPPTNHR